MDLLRNTSSTRNSAIHSSEDKDVSEEEPLKESKSKSEKERKWHKKPKREKKKKKHRKELQSETNRKEKDEEEIWKETDRKKKKRTENISKTDIGTSKESREETRREKKEETDRKKKERKIKKKHGSRSSRETGKKQKKDKISPGLSQHVLQSTEAFEPCYFTEGNGNNLNKMNSDDNTQDWINFFRNAGIERTKSEDYAKIFLQKCVTFDQLESLSEEYLLGLTLSSPMDNSLILEHALQVSDSAKGEIKRSELDLKSLKSELKLEKLKIRKRGSKLDPVTESRSGVKVKTENSERLDCFKSDLAKTKSVDLASSRKRKVDESFKDKTLCHQSPDFDNVSKNYPDLGKCLNRTLPDREYFSSQNPKSTEDKSANGKSSLKNSSDRKSSKDLESKELFLPLKYDASSDSEETSRSQKSNYAKNLDSSEETTTSIFLVKTINQIRQVTKISSNHPCLRKLRIYELSHSELMSLSVLPRPGS